MAGRYRRRQGSAERRALLVGGLAGLAARDDQDVSFAAWAGRVPEPKTGSLDFARFPYQRELYEKGADDREMVVMKSTQVGVSAWAVRWALYHADTNGLTGLYIFPTQGDMYDFSAARIRPMIEGSDYLSARMPPGEADNKGLKRVGAGYVYFRGSESKRKLDSVDCDHLVFDEYDTLAQANIPDAERRVSGPLSRGLVRRVGVPSIPDFGIGKRYAESDQREWIVRCDRCSEHQQLDFYENVDLSTATVVCRTCRKLLDVTAGEWVPRFPNRAVRGYHVPRLIVPSANVASMIEASTRGAGYERQVFHNKDLGIPFAPEEGRLSAAALDAAQAAGGHQMVSSYAGPNPATMGVDVASARPLTVRISERLPSGAARALWIGAVDADSGAELLYALATLMERYSVSMAVIDHLPEGRLARDFRAHHPGRVYIASYSESLASGEPWNVNDGLCTLSAQRVTAIDDTMADIRAQRNLLPCDLPTGYRSELQALVRVVEQRDDGRVRVRYLSTGPDDYAHAEVYDRLAWIMLARQLLIDEASAETYSTLDDHLGFERADLDWYDASPNREPPVYRTGFERQEMMARLELLSELDAEDDS